MKKLLLITLMVFGTMTLMAQNQFRDYIDFKQGQLPPQERPQIERKDGKVIITMSEEMFRQMQMNRGMMMNHHFGHTHRPPFICDACKRNMGRGVRFPGKKPSPPQRPYIKNKF